MTATATLESPAVTTSDPEILVDDYGNVMSQQATEVVVESVVEKPSPAFVPHLEAKEIIAKDALIKELELKQQRQASGQIPVLPAEGIGNKIKQNMIYRREMKRAESDAEAIAKFERKLKRSGKTTTYQPTDESRTEARTQLELETKRQADRQEAYKTPRERMKLATERTKHVSRISAERGKIAGRAVAERSKQAAERTKLFTAERAKAIAGRAAKLATKRGGIAGRMWSQHRQGINQIRQIKQNANINVAQADTAISSVESTGTVDQRQPSYD